MTHLATVGPLAIASDASRWQLYGSGVFSGCKYENNIALNHAIQLVGYGSDPDHGDFWLVRNSWGSTWGEHGYIRLQRYRNFQAIIRAYRPLVPCYQSQSISVCLSKD